MTETASEILGKHRQKKKPWITAEILDLCDKRRELRKKRFEPEGSEKYQEVNKNGEPFSCFFPSGNGKRSQGERSGEYGGCGSCCTSLAMRKSTVVTAVVALALLR